jgi:ribosomal protein L35AE/L33A
MVASLQQQHQKQRPRKAVVRVHELESEEKYELYAPGQVYFPRGRQELPVPPPELP